MAKITILGDGAWGTAIAQLLANNGHEILLWCHNASVAHEITTDHTNTQYLPNISLNPQISATTNNAHAFAFSLIIVEALPVKFVRTVITSAQPYITDAHQWVLLSKGIENETGMLTSEIIADCLKKPVQLSVISGPSYARDIALQQPTHVIIAADDQTYAAQIAQLFDNHFFRLIPSSDVRGVQLCGAFKNVAALILGMIAGAGYGDNTIILAFMRLLDEMEQFVIAHHGYANTVRSYAGLGDLVLTAFGTKSKNKQVGMLIGAGTNLQTIAQQMDTLPEGINTITSLMQACKKQKLTLPLCSVAYTVTFENEPIASLIDTITYR